MERAKFTIVNFPNREGWIKDAAKQKSDQILQKSDIAECRLTSINVWNIDKIKRGRHKNTKRIWDVQEILGQRHVLIDNKDLW